MRNESIGQSWERLKMKKKMESIIPGEDKTVKALRAFLERNAAQAGVTEEVKLRLFGRLDALSNQKAAALEAKLSEKGMAVRDVLAAIRINPEEHLELDDGEWVEMAGYFMLSLRQCCQTAA